ncbi:hypothetical protein GCM10023187_22960 [Nibrella viscosa]|uniref:Glycoside hydrolase family 2 n=2 Tax=Nibrella viscosa TaxID=1084524 RepID=A0ABP8KEK6_9BACT
MPLPEHPRPDVERANWLNLNGLWSFRFDPNDQGLQQRWFSGTQQFPLSINVPFPWGAPLSGVKDEADIAWYQRTITVPANWKGQRVFLTIGASDWLTTVWLDGQELGKHQGGYTPFSFELTRFLKPGQPQKLVVRVDDKRRDFTLYGKQGYGNARGIWQTIYLESRGDAYLDALHFTPDIDKNKVRVTAYLPEAAQKDLRLNLRINTNNGPITATQNIPKGRQQVAFEVAIPNARRWTLDDPYLHTVEARLSGGGTTDDVLNSYFGMRKISVMDMPGTNIPYVALNNEPVYLQLALDQSYHPEGYYTFPSDAFMRNEILLARQIGLNGIRTHIKADIPRKLYWADKLGVLVMSDLPNSWGQPDEPMQKESEYTLREMIKRDYNHPAIFSWITFNETWGLTTKKKVNGKEVAEYTPETQKWVASVYRLAKSLDSTRIVEDNSVCCGRGHTETDLNSWHEYLPGYGWEEHLAKLTKNLYPGSAANFEKGYQQARQPNINSEFGNVWGYDGSTGDVDYTYDYHRAINTFRKYPQVAGWLYTEHHDVINEWNGYYRYDRTEKMTGLDELVPGMSLRDFHAPLYISTGQDITRTVKPGTTAAVPLFASFMTGRNDLGNSLVVSAKLYGWDALGQEKTWWMSDKDIPYQPWMQRALDSLRVPIPNEKSVAILALQLKDRSGTVHHRNFMTFVVDAPAPRELALADGRKARLIQFPVASFKDANWSRKQWNVLDGKKVNGAGSGYFEYRVAVPRDINLANVAMASLVMEAGAKQLFGKDMGDGKIEGDYMLGRGTADPSRNPNAYPQTDETRFPSAVTVWVNGENSGRYDLPDDPGDHRGILSWHAQPQNRKLNEAGSYGYRLSVPIAAEALRKAAQTGELLIRLAVDDGLPGGLALYGSDFGRYPIDPTVVLVLK